MAEEAKITFYNIDRCGYYRRGDDTPRLSNVSDIFLELQAWINGKSLGQTKTFDVDEENEIYPVYCFDLIDASNNGDFLLTTWNEVPSAENAVASIDPSSQVGDPQMYLNPIEEDTIPGFATYFWILPSESLIATITFRHRINGQRALLRYLKEFMEKSTRYAVIEEGEEQDFVLGYCDDEDEEPENLLPYFKTSLVRLPGHVDRLRDKIQDIRKIIRKKTLHLTQQKDVRFMRSIMEHIGIESTQDSETVHNIKYEINYTPDAEEFENMVEEAFSEDGSWEDTGFQLQNDPKTYWVSYSYARDSSDLSVRRENDELVDAESLLNALTRQRRQLLRRVQREKS